MRTDQSFLILCTVLGIVQAWISRYAMNSDGISYIDIGDAYVRGDWAAAINGYWSPMYSWWLGLALRLLKPSIRWEFVVVHLVNLAIYFVALFSFRFFIRCVLNALKAESQARGDDALPLPDWALLGLGYSLFLWCSLELIDVELVTPDLLVAAVFFLICGYLVDLRVHESYGKFAIFGALCGAAYLAKAIMFPLGFGLLTILFLSGSKSKHRVGGVLLSALLFLVVSVPFVAAVSKQKGRFTFGDSGRLAYASMVSPNSPQTHWQGEPVGSGIPRHTTRKLLDNPPVFEFGAPVGGTYPPWYDPSYWNEGQRGHFRLRSQIRVLVQSTLSYARTLQGQLGLLAGLLFFLFVGGTPTRRAIVSNWPLIAAAFLGLGAYSLVLVRTRYIGPFLVLLLFAVLAGIRLKSGQLNLLSKPVTTAMMATMLLSVGVRLVENAYTTLTVGPYSQMEQVEAAEGLRGMGLRGGDRVAVIGDGMTNFWARLGRFKIVSEVYSPDRGDREFWASSTERQESAYQCLERTGARAVVAWDPPENYLNQGWKQISNTRYYARFLSK
ncbi:MAG: hypothetical protein ACYDDS_14565 [Candidatus Sulfotelmatobacter sp.]